MGNDLYSLPSSHWSTWKLILHYYPIMIDWKMWLCVSIRWLLLPIVNMIYMWFLFYFDNYHFFLFFFLSKKYMLKSIFGLNLYSLISRYSIRSTHEKDFPHSNILIPSKYVSKGKWFWQWAFHPTSLQKKRKIFYVQSI